MVKAEQSRGEGCLFSMNLMDKSGEIRAKWFTDVVDKFYTMLEVNKVNNRLKGLAI